MILPPLPKSVMLQLFLSSSTPDSPAFLSMTHTHFGFMLFVQFEYLLVHLQLGSDLRTKIKTLAFHEG